MFVALYNDYESRFILVFWLNMLLNLSGSSYSYTFAALSSLTTTKNQMFLLILS